MLKIEDRRSQRAQTSRPSQHQTGGFAGEKLSASEDFVAFLNEDNKFWAKLVKDAGVKAE